MHQKKLNRGAKASISKPAPIFPFLPTFKPKSKFQEAFKDDKVRLCVPNKKSMIPISANS